MYGGLNCFKSDSYLNFYGPFDGSGTLLTLKPHYATQVEIDIFFFFPVGQTLNDGQVLIKGELEEIVQQSSSANCLSGIDTANSNYPFQKCTIQKTMFHQFDTFSVQIKGITTASEYFWGIQRMIFITSECASSCLVCENSTTCVQTNLSPMLMQQYYYERELYEARVENTLILNKYCLVSEFIFLNSDFYPFIGLSSSSNLNLMNPQTILIELENLPVHYQIYVQFKLIQAKCGTTLSIYYDEQPINYYQGQITPCQKYPVTSFIEFTINPHHSSETTFSLQQVGSSFGIRELKIIFGLCQSTCIICSDGTSCDPDNGIEKIASFVYQINSANLIREDWIIIGSPSTTYISTCNNVNFFGGLNIFDWKTKVQNYFHITSPHYSAKLQIEFIKINNWAGKKILIIIDGKVLRQISFCESNRRICSPNTSLGGDQIKKFSFEFPHYSYDLSISIQPDIQTDPGTQFNWGFNKFNLSVQKCHSSCNSRYCTGPLSTNCGLPNNDLHQIRSFFSFIPPATLEPSWTITNQLASCSTSPLQSCQTGSMEFYGGQGCFNAATKLTRTYSIKDSFVFMIIQFDFIKVGNWQTQGSLIVSVNGNIKYEEIFSSTQGINSCQSSGAQDIIIYPVKIELKYEQTTQQDFLVSIQTQNHSGFWAVKSFQLDLFGCQLGMYFENNSCKSCTIPKCLTCTNLSQCFSQCHQSCDTCYGDSQYECKSCDSSLNRVLEGSVCKCNTGYFEIGQPACQQCHQTCMQCTDIYINSCSFCDKNQYRQLDEVNKKCVCVERFYEQSTQLQCKRCHFSCLSCNGDLDSNCLTCSQAADKRVFDPTTGKCVCEDGYYENTTLNKCLPCQLKCNKCESIASNCIECGQNRIQLPTCVCPTTDKVWLDGETCNLCHSSCQECFGFNYNECSSCTGSLYLYSFKCIPLCQFFEYFGDVQNGKNVCLKRCPNSQYQVTKRLCCLDNSEACLEEITNELIYYSATDNKPNNVKIKFSRPIRVEYAQSYERIIQLSMENISSFISKITPLDEIGGYVQTIDLKAVPQQSVLYSILKINLLADYIRDTSGIPHSKKTSSLTAKFGKTEFIPEDQVDAIKNASDKAKATSQVISIMGAAFYFLNVCQLLDIVVDVMQWSYYYTFISVVYPINSDLFFSTFNNINLNIKIFDIEISSSGDQQVLGSNLVNQVAPQKFTEQNITSSFMLNGASFLMTLSGFIIGRYLLVSIHDCYNQTEDDHKYSIICQALKFVKNFLSFAPIIKFIQSSFFGIVFSACLQLRNIDTSNSFNQGSIALCIGTIILFIISIGYFMYKINKCEGETRFEEKYGSLFEFYNRDKFITRNFAFWIFIKKGLMMGSLIFLYDNLYTNLIFMGSVCILFSIFIYFSKPYTLARMNDFHIFSEFLLIICLVIIYEIEDCNVQISSQGDQGIDQNIIEKKLFLGWWLIIITIAHIFIIISAISGLLWKNIKEQITIYTIQIKKICNLCYTNFFNKIQFFYRSLMVYYFDKTTDEKIWLYFFYCQLYLLIIFLFILYNRPDILKEMKNFHIFFMSCPSKGRWKSSSIILLTENQAINKLQNAPFKFQLGEFIFFIESSKNKKEFRAWVWTESYQMQLHNQAENYFKEKLEISKQYLKRYERNPLYKQLFKQLIMYSNDFDRKINPENLLDKYSEQHFSELYNIVTYRNYWNFIRGEIDLKSFIRNDEISELYFISNKINNNDILEDESNTNENQNLKNLAISLENKYSEKILVNRCQCQYCQGIYFAKDYVDKIDWKIFYHFKENYMKPYDLLNMLNNLEEKLVLLLKDILNERVNILETGHIITPEEIENNEIELINDPKYSLGANLENVTKDTSKEILDSTINQTRKQLKKKLISGQQLEMTNITPSNKKKQKQQSKDKDSKNKKQGNKKNLDKKKEKQYNIFEDFEYNTFETEEEEEEEQIIMDKYVRFKIFKWTEV